MNRDRSVFTKALLHRSTSFLAVLIFSANSAFAADTSGAAFLKIPIGAEPAGLGQAYTAMAHGINALNWNPAGILQSPTSMGRPTMGLSVSHQNQFEENDLDHLGVVVPSGSGKNSWGFDLIRLSYLNQTGRDVQGNATGSLSASDMAIGAALAHNFGRYQIGTQVKIIRQELAGSQAQGFAVDMGLLSATAYPRLTLGAAVRNFGPSMKIAQDAYDLPLTMSVGSAYRITGPLTLAIDVHYKPRQQQTVLAIGTQMMAGKNFVLRAGYLSKLAEGITNTQKSETNRGNIANVSGIAAGMGFQFKQFNLDYSITPFGELGDTQMLTLSTWFGGSTDKNDSLGAMPEADGAEPSNTRVILILPVSNEPWWGSLR